MVMHSDIHSDSRFSMPARDPASLPGEWVPYLLSTADAFVILVSSVVGGLLYHLVFFGGVPDLTPFCAVGLLASFIYILRMSGGGHYELLDAARPGVELGPILVCWFSTGLLLAFFAFLLKVGVDYSRGAFVALYFLAPVGLLAVRKATKVALSSAVSRGALSRKDMVVVGDPAELGGLDHRDMLAFCGASNLDCFSFSAGKGGLVWTDADERMVADVVSYVREHNCREIMLAVPWDDSARIELIRERFKVLPVSIRLLPDSHVRSLSNFTSSARQRVLAIELQRAPLGTTERLAKRVMDLVISTTALIVLLPLLVLTALAIKLDDGGPVIFRQRRKGFNGQEFVMYKFRTMKVQEDGPVVTQATRNDPRVTAIGRLLRAASIDELPQLINVIRGDMSLIGPRPHALAHDNEFQKLLEDYAFRHHVKPGLTGWAQCNGSRGATPSVEDIAERVKLDLWYINNWSLLLDLQILVKTAFEVFRKRNAY